MAANLVELQALKRAARRQTQCLVVGVLLTCALASSTGPARAQEPALLIKAGPGADLHIEADARCRPSPGDIYAIIPAPHARFSNLWLLAQRPLGTGDCQYGAALKATQPTFDKLYLIVKEDKQEHLRYHMLLEPNFLDFQRTTETQLEIRLKTIERVWPRFADESATVRAALQALWERDVQSAFRSSVSGTKLRGPDGRDTPPRLQDTGRDAFVLTTPQSWTGGDLVFTAPRFQVAVPPHPATRQRQERTPLPPAERSSWWPALDGWAAPAIAALGILLLFAAFQRWRKWLPNRGRRRGRRVEYATGGRRDAGQNDDRYLSYRTEVLHLKAEVDQLRSTLASHIRSQGSFNDTVDNALSRLAEDRAGQASQSPASAPQSQPSEKITVRPAGARAGYLLAAPAPNVEQLAWELLDLFEKEGSASPYARLGTVRTWLERNHRGVVTAEAVGETANDRWLLLVLATGGDSAIVVPALDTTIGAGEALRWFEGGRYDGTQHLHRSHVRTLGRANRDSRTGLWQPREKGLIVLP